MAHTTRTHSTSHKQSVGACPRSRHAHCAARSPSRLRPAAQQAEGEAVLGSVGPEGEPGLKGSSATPIVDALLERGRRSDEVSLHVPGHKRGAGASSQLLSVLGVDALRHDLTELSGLDYLSSPTGCIAEAQARAATVFGARRTWFLVNGSSCGLHAAIMATCGVGGGGYGGVLGGPSGNGSPAAEEQLPTLVLARNCHLSAFAGMVLAGCRPHYVMPELDADTGVAHGLTPAAVEAALAEVEEEEEGPIPRAAGRGGGGRQGRAAALLLVSPTYFGACSDLRAVCDVARRRGVAVIVDEAHGGHFGRHPALPQSALALGADLVVQSTHKVLGSLTQSAMLHSGPKSAVDDDRIARVLQLLQSSSPSYLLLASLDAATAQAAHASTFDAPLQAAEYARAQLAGLPGVRLLGGGGGAVEHGGGGAPECAEPTMTLITDQQRPQLPEQPSAQAGSSSGSGGSGSSGSGDDNRHVPMNQRRRSPEQPLAQASSSSCGGSGDGNRNVHGAGPAAGPAAGPTAAAKPVCYEFDPLRLSVIVDGLGLTGFEAAALLEQRHGVVPELATAKMVVLAMGAGTRMHDAVRLVAAMKQLTADAPKQVGGGMQEGPVASQVGGSPGAAAAAAAAAVQQWSAPDIVVTPREAHFAATERVAWEEAEGRVCAELLCPYPPGIPVACPGERLSVGVLGTLRQVAEGGGVVVGASDATLRTVLVLEQQQ